MRRPVRPERVCRRCPFCGPGGECLDPALKSGHCGDWIWFVRHRKQIRRPYIVPLDPRTPAQLRSRARLTAASRRYSCFLTEKERNACIAAGAQRRSRPRLFQSGPLTGQQYSISREYALQKAHENGIKPALAPQLLQPQEVRATSSDRPHSAPKVSPGHRRTPAEPPPEHVDAATHETHRNSAKSAISAGGGQATIGLPSGSHRATSGLPTCIPHASLMRPTSYPRGNAEERMKNEGVPIVAADGSRRCLGPRRNAPTAVGGYTLLANRAECEPSGLGSPKATSEPHQSATKAC